MSMAHAKVIAGEGRQRVGGKVCCSDVLVLDLRPDHVLL